MESEVARDRRTKAQLAERRVGKVIEFKTLGVSLVVRSPWEIIHLDDELGGARGRMERAMAVQLVKVEYEGCPDAVSCDCGGKAWYRATVGCMTCTSCGALYHSDGTAVGTRGKGK